MIIGFSRSIAAYINSIKFLGYPWVFKYLFFSGVASLACFSLLSWMIFSFGGNLIDQILSGQLPGWISSIIKLATNIVLWSVLVFVFKYIVLIITSPMMSGLSKEIESKYAIEPNPKVRGQLYSTIRGTRIAISNLLRELLVSGILMVVATAMFFIPGMALAVPVLIILIQSYYAGFSNIDFFMERRFSARESRKFIYRNKGMAIGNGLGFLALFLIPIVGAFVAPSLATISGTLGSLQLLEDDNF